MLNTLFVTSEDVFLTLDGENVVARKKEETLARYPLHTLQAIISFSYAGASPALMHACLERNVGLSFCTPRGRFLARVSGLQNGNVLLRREQYRIADDPIRSCLIARNMIVGKLYNARWSLARTVRDYKERIDAELFQKSSIILNQQMNSAAVEDNLEALRGTEGVGAAAYFEVFDHMILRDKNHFFFHGRNRRPPLDNVNALLSFIYVLLANDCASALESVGLDSYVGFLHKDRPGRTSLALDLMEELRPCMADRFVLTAINNRIVQASDFEALESGAVLLKDDGRKRILKAWQERKTVKVTHPYLQEKLSWGMVPYAQSLLLARTLRGDLDGYPPFLWK